jgi:hypothetical protein
MRPYRNNLPISNSVSLIVLTLLISGIMGLLLVPSVHGQETSNINENTDWITLAGNYDYLANLHYSNETSWKSDEYTILNGFMQNGRIFNGTVEHAMFLNDTRINALIINQKVYAFSFDSDFTEPEENKPTINLVPLAEKINAWMVNPYFWFIIFLIFAIMFRSYYYMMHEPYIKLRRWETLQKINLGRFIHEEPIADAHLWRYTFKDVSGVHLYYADRSFSEYAPFCFEKFMSIFHYYPDLVFLTLNVPENITLQNRTIAHTWKNFFLRIPYGICVLFSLISWSISLFKKFDFTGDRVEQIPYIMSIPMMEQMDLTFDCAYEKLELDDKDGTEKWMAHNLSKIPLSEILAVQKNPDKIRNFQWVGIHHDQVKYNSIQECVKDRRTRLLDRAYFESRKLFYEKTVQTTYELYKQVAEELTTNKLTEEERFHEMYSKIDAVNTDRNHSLPEMLALYNKNRSLGMDEAEALKRAVLHKIDQEYGQEKVDLMKENAQLTAQIALYEQMLKERLVQLENHQITVRKEYNVDESEVIP